MDAFKIFLLCFIVSGCASTQVSAKVDQNKKDTHISLNKEQSEPGKASIKDKEELKKKTENELKNKPKKTSKKNKDLRGSDPQVESIKEVMGLYFATKAVKIKLKKISYMSLLEREKKSSGILYLSKGRLRLETKSPEKSLIVMNKKNIWVEQPLPKEFGGGLQVTKIQIRSREQISRTPLAFLFNDEDVWDQFMVIKSEATKKGKKYHLQPKNKKDWQEVKKVVIEINNEKSQLDQLEYFDELENKVTYVFLKTQLGANVSAKKFRYSPPKNAEITEL